MPVAAALQGREPAQTAGSASPRHLRHIRFLDQVHGSRGTRAYIDACQQSSSVACCITSGSGWHTLHHVGQSRCDRSFEILQEIPFQLLQGPELIRLARDQPLQRTWHLGQLLVNVSTTPTSGFPSISAGKVPQWCGCVKRYSSQCLQNTRLIAGLITRPEIAAHAYRTTCSRTSA